MSRFGLHLALDFSALEPWTDGVLGYALDLVWVTCLWRAAARAPWLSWLMATFLALRLFDLWCVLWTGVHAGPVVWLHADAGMWRVAWESGLPVLVCGGAGACWMVQRLARRSPLSRRGWVPAMALCSILAFTSARPTHGGDLASLPELNVPIGLLRHTLRREIGVEQVELAPEDIESWRRRGWLPRRGAKALKSDVPSARRPRGVVIVLLESFAASLSPVYDASAPLKTPGLVQVAEHSVTIDGYRTQASPTHSGLLASLCGVLPSSWPLTHAASASLPRLPRCLPAAVAEAGGRSVLLQSSPLQFTGVDKLADAMGFDEARGSEALGRGRELAGSWGLRDAQLYRLAIDEVDKLHRGERPFLIVLSTSDGHLPGAPPAGCRAHPGGSTWLRSQACADRDLGAFVAEIEGRPGWGDVAVVVTADHGPPRVATVKRALPNQPHFAKLPLLVWRRHSKARRVVVHGGQLDLAATVASLMGVVFHRGVDLLGDRQARRQRTLIATSDRRVIGLEVDGRWRELPHGRMARRCQSSFTPDEERRLYCDALKFLRTLDGMWFHDRLRRWW